MHNIPHCHLKAVLATYLILSIVSITASVGGFTIRIPNETKFSAVLCCSGGSLWNVLIVTRLL